MHLSAFSVLFENVGKKSLGQSAKRGETFIGAARRILFGRAVRDSYLGRDGGGALTAERLTCNREKEPFPSDPLAVGFRVCGKQKLCVFERKSFMSIILPHLSERIISLPLSPPPPLPSLRKPLDLCFA